MNEELIVRPQARPNQQKVVVHRLTVLMNAYHQVHGGDAKDVRPIPFELELSSEEEMYQRTTRIGLTAQPLDLGWTDGLKIALLCVENKEPVKEKDRVIELLLNGDAALLVPAGGAVFFTPVEVADWSIRGQVDAIQFTLSSVPW